MTESEDMAPSKVRGRSVEVRGSDAVSDYLLPKESVEQRERSITASDAIGIKNTRDDDGDSDDDSDGGGGGGGNKNGGGDGNGKGNGKGNGDKNKGNNKADNKNNGGGNNNTDNNFTTTTSSLDFGSSLTAPVFPQPTDTLEFPPLAVPAATLVSTSSPPAVTTTKTSTSIATATSTKPVTSVVETTSVVTSVQMATMTTTIPVVATIAPSVTISSQPRKGVDGPGDFTSPFPVLGSTGSVSTVTATDTTATVTATAIADTLGGNDSSNNNTKGSGGGHGKKDSNDPPPGALDPTAEHALIAVGSIGAFVLICFVGWVIYRTLKKSRRGQDMNNGNGGLINRLPWRRNQNNDMWNDRNGYMSNDIPPPMYEKGNHNSMQEAGFYGVEKKYQQQQPGGLTRTNTASSQRSMLPQLAPGSVIMIPAEQYMAMSQTQSPVGSDQTGTMRSLMPDAFFNQSELARQPSDAYDPARRQVNRASALSSLSSGFGDGDIIIPEEYLNKPQPAASQLRQSNNFITRFSWMSRRDAGDRETVYTTTSEDRPAKYRSVGSWVNQQTGRLKRADERQQEVPPMPDLPPNLDTQGPRRP